MASRPPTLDYGSPPDKLPVRRYGADVCGGTVCSHGTDAQNAGVTATTVLVAVESAQVREGLVAMLGAVDGFRVVAEADSDELAIEAARNYHPRVALIDLELSGAGGWWAIQQIESEHLAGVVVALGRRADGALAAHLGAQSYVQMGTSPRDLLSAVQAAIAFRANGASGAQAEHDLLPDADAVLEKPALVDF
jgi:DNA-binding NarL/FixJ family response regulator